MSIKYIHLVLSIYYVSLLTSIFCLYLIPDMFQVDCIPRNNFQVYSKTSYICDGLYSSFDDIREIAHAKKREECLFITAIFLLSILLVKIIYEIQKRITGISIALN